MTSAEEAEALRRHASDLEAQVTAVTAERNKYHAALVDLRLDALEKGHADHENRLRPVEAGQVKANTIYALIAGNGILSAVALFKIFMP